MKFLSSIIGFLATLQCIYAQDSLQYRIILIGDAGEITTAQQAILADAVKRSLPGKTMALFLGDNVYPKGLETSEPQKMTTEAILRSQFVALRKNGIPVYFVPGNHDWDKSGPNGYTKMKVTNAFFKAQQDSLLKLIPEDACPGPYELKVTDNLVIVAMDSEWWLYPYNNEADNSGCICKTKRDVLGRLDDIIRRNNNKLIIFATHHPFKTYGTHGGYYTLKEHIFPLTQLNKNLYIPLPLIGSLYPLLRKALPPPEDLGNVLNKDMQETVNAILKKNPNAVHVSGHEHTLQLIQSDVLQVVSGAGAKHTPVKMGKGSIYAEANSGYVLADVMKDNSIRFTFLTYTHDSIKESYTYTKAYTVPVSTTENIVENIVSDSISIQLNPQFDKVSGIHRSLFGENYRKTWAMKTVLPVLHISKNHMLPKELGGGMQTHSLRLEDAKGKEWILRSLDKFPDAILPQALNQTLASDILKDNGSANFPYAPITVPVIANALGVPHTDPSIVYIAPDSNLGIYSRDFANTIALLEEREPLGKSYSTIKMDAKLKEDNDNIVDQRAFLTARIQDIFLGDWDRHDDQWRWVYVTKGKDKLFKPVPRDRDQVFYVNQGFLPWIVSLPWLVPKFEGFSGRVRNVNTFSFNARLIDGIYTNALSYEDWMKATQHAVIALTDSVIDAALKKMPATVYNETHIKLAERLQKRRQDLLRVMPSYYRFINKTIDLITSDKNEQVLIHDTLHGMLYVEIHKTTNEKDIGKIFYSRILDPAITKELRLYINGGNDKVIVRNNKSPIKIRIVGDGLSAKQYEFSGVTKYLRKIHVYDGESNATFRGNYHGVHQHLSADAENTALQLTDRYNKAIPLLLTGYNVDDGFMLGGGIKWIKQGFRKKPYSNIQTFTAAHSFSSKAYRAYYKGEWLHLLNQTDFTLQAKVFAPDNTQNFFGRGNTTEYDKTGNYLRYYRARFNYYTVDPALRWRSEKKGSFSVGPSFQYYKYDVNGNTGRLISKSDLLHSYDSSTIAYDKAHLGIAGDYTRDSRNNIMLPSFGTFINFKLMGYAGLNTYSKSYFQFTGQLAFYRNLDRKSNFIIANRIGGGFTAGNATFYQSLFLGGQTNLQGYRQFRFAGEHLLYDNIELRIKLGNLASYILPGQFGLIAFYDIGKVWQHGYTDKIWHQGAGGGFYFMPAQLFVVQLVVGNSDEGLYPYFTAGFRF